MSKECELPDPAAVLGCAVSLWHECRRVAEQAGINLSECYHGMDELMREVMRVAQRFEEWSCRHVAFREVTDMWPYLLEDRFGTACVEAMGVENLSAFDGDDCLRIALRLRIPVKPDGALPLPIDVAAANPLEGSEFGQLRIRTMRYRDSDDEPEPFTADDEPYDEDCGPLFFSLCGVDREGRLEPIASRPTFEQAVQLAKRLAPGIAFHSGAA